MKSRKTKAPYYQRVKKTMKTKGLLLLANAVLGTSPKAKRQVGIFLCPRNPTRRYRSGWGTSVFAP
jgi:hypothetical protein